MKYLSKITLVFLLIPAITFAIVDKKKEEKSKTLKKSYTVNSDATVTIDNRYGNINIVTWDKNEVEIEVTITVEGNDEDRVLERLENITVEFDASKNAVFAKTILEKTRKSWTFWSQNRNISHQINYQVKMPVSNNVVLDNDYGNIFLDNLDGKASITCDYGNIAVDRLNSSDNAINLDYCNNSTIGYMRNGNLDLDYSKIAVDEANNVIINADYSTTSLGKTISVDYNADYGAVSVEEVEELEGNSDYTNVKFGWVKGSLNVEADYGAISIERLAAGFKNVSLDSKYAAIKIYVEPDANFNFEIDMKYSSLSGSQDKMDFEQKVQNSSKRYYKGAYGNGSSNSFLKIDSQYGGVTIKEY